jgi:hypothetical protein
MHLSVSYAANRSSLGPSGFDHRGLQLCMAPDNDAKALIRLRDELVRCLQCTREQRYGGANIG